MWEILGRWEHVLRDVSLALGLYREAGCELGEARALNTLGRYAAHRGDYACALRHCRAALELQVRLGDRHGQTASGHHLGNVLHRRGEFERAAAAYNRTLVLARESGDLFHEAGLLDDRGDTYAAGGRPGEAALSWTAALSILDRLEHADAVLVRAKLEADSGARAA